MGYHIWLIGVAAGLLIIGLIAVNVFLVRWVCKRKREKRMQRLRNAERSHQAPANLVNNTRRGATSNNEVKYVTQATMNKGKAAKKGKRKKKVNYENSDSDVFGRCGDIPALPVEYTFDNLQRDHRPRKFDDDEPSNEYGHIHLGIDDENNEYDSARFIVKKELCEVDSTYASVDKSTRGKRDSTYNHASYHKDVDTDDTSFIELPKRGYLSKPSDYSEETGYELSKNISSEKPHCAQAATEGDDNILVERSEEENSLEATQNSKMGTEEGCKPSYYSCTNGLTSGNEDLSVKSRKSAGTQVESMDFSCTPSADTF